jgi:hypothetical protein
MIINVDCDGILLSNRLESTLNQKVIETGWSYNESSHVWDWYQELITMSHLRRNDSFLKHLNQLKEMGHVIRLWTNRNYELHKFTVRELGPFAGIFDSFIYNNGSKYLSRVEGIVVDNSPKYLHCGEKGGVLFPTFI